MFIPKVEANELDRIGRELVNQYAAAIFDGQSRLGELMNLVLRWCTADFFLVQRLTALVTLSHHMTGIQICTLLT